MPNIPNYQYGDVRVSEHDSVMRVIARIHKPELLGKTLPE